MDSWTEMVFAADGEQLHRMLEDVLERYAELYPQWEVHMVSLERSCSRAEQIDRMIELLRALRDTK